MLKREKGFHAAVTIDPLNAVSTTIAFRGSDGMYALSVKTTRPTIRAAPFARLDVDGLRFHEPLRDGMRG
jgi:hypothetical protein